MDTPKSETPNYTMPLDELLDLLGATRRVTPRRPRPKGDRRRLHVPEAPDDQPKADV